MGLDLPMQIALLIALVMGFLIALFLELRYIKKKGIRKKFMSKRIKEKERELKKDRAFNALHTAKLLRNRLNTNGIDTRKAQYMIDKADTALSYGDYESCAEMCRVAKEELLKCKHSGILTDRDEEKTIDMMTDKGIKTKGSVLESDSEEARKFMAGVGSDLFLQSKFELNAAKGDLTLFDGPTDERKRASQLIEEADGLFEAKNYQKSLSISFRARKILCGELEEETDQAAEVVPEEVEKAEKQGGEISECCLACGATVAEEDLFCGLCGSPVKERKCTSCGASLKSGDTFCRKCGARN